MQKIQAGGAQVAILSYGLWQTAVSWRWVAVGKAILLRARPHTVIGVMPQDFRTDPQPTFDSAAAQPHWRGGGINYAVVARLKPGATIAAANAQLDAIEQPLLVAMKFAKARKCMRT